ncbi:MAG: ABC transporter permease subunit, partial [Clostridia bacterium]|nr:ABC transporter permease subunit [Clostridia bacterium]
CVIITIISALIGFNSVDKEKIELLKAMGANKFQILWKLILPSNLPNIISILKINVGLSWVGTIMGEYLVSKEGIGYLLVYGSQVFKLDLVMASTILLCVLATLMYLAVALIEKIIHRSFK